MTNRVAQAYEAHYLPLVRLARQFVDDLESAEEVVQDVYVRLHARRRETGDLGYPYLRAAVLNQCRSHLRHRAVVRRHRLAEPSPEVQPAPDLATGVANQDQIRAAIARLPRRQGEVVVLRYFEDLSVKEIAAALGISGNATSAALNRARATISEYVGADR